MYVTTYSIDKTIVHEYTFPANLTEFTNINAPDY